MNLDDTKFISPLPLYRSALELCMPDILIKEAMSLSQNTLTVGNYHISIKSKINILAYGKASRLMYYSARKIIGRKFFGSGLLISHEAETESLTHSSSEKFITSSHPFITSLSKNAGSEAMNFVQKQNNNDVLLVLVSGGGSAMVASPIEGLDLKEKINFITKIMHLSVPEREVNVLKKALSKIKGGKLAEASSGKTIINCILSDERNHQVSAISSGMTVHNKSINPIKIMDKYNLWHEASDNIRNVLIRHGEKKDIAINKNIINSIIGSRENLIDAIKDNAKNFGFKCTYVLENMHSCSSETATDILIKEFQKIYDSSHKGKYLIVSTGEIQVKVNKKIKSAKGGRNQHLVALFMKKFIPDFDFNFIAVGTDGMDYLEGVHGAFYDSSMSKKIQQNRNYIQSKINTSNTYEVHKRFGTLIEGSKTGTNMSDFFLFSFVK
jgi:glycerate 2-kinase